MVLQIYILNTPQLLLMVKINPRNPLILENWKFIETHSCLNDKWVKKDIDMIQRKFVINNDYNSSFKMSVSFISQNSWKSRNVFYLRSAISATNNGIQRLTPPNVKPVINRPIKITFIEFDVIKMIQKACHKEWRTIELCNFPEIDYSSCSNMYIPCLEKWVN